MKITIVPIGNANKFAIAIQFKIQMTVPLRWRIIRPKRQKGS
jgi:hypothetical protein